MVRGSDRHESMFQRPNHSSAQRGKDANEVTVSEGELGSLPRDKKKWRRLQRSNFPSSQFQVVMPQVSNLLRWDYGGGGFPQVFNPALF
ncbi:hypothetical protein ACFX2I_023332 [Malus domestica]